MNKIILIIGIICSCFFSSTAQNTQAISDFQKNNALKYASIGFLIMDENEKELVSINKKTSFTPASTLKIVTTATALELFGNKFRFKTNLFYDSNQIFVSGEGDPTLGSEYFYQNKNDFLNEWVTQIEKLNINTSIHLYINDNYFGYQGTARKWIREDLGNYYAAGAYGISVYDNTYRLFFNTVDTSKPPRILRTEPEMKDIIFLNALKYNSTGSDNGYIWGEPFSNNRQLVGDIPSKKVSFSIKGDIPDPGKYLGQSLADILLTKGINVQAVETARSDYYNKINIANKLNTLTPFHIHQSPKLADIIRVINVKSNNHYTEHLIRRIGRFSKPDVFSEPLQEGISYITSFWKSKGLDTNGLFMYDGCGLSPSNAISAELLCNILSYMMHKSPYSADFLASFPRAGVDGTVRNILKGTRLEGKIYMKSGSIAGVQSYAGYYIKGDKKYTFAILVNKFNNKDRGRVRKAIETLLLNTLP